MRKLYAATISKYFAAFVFVISVLFVQSLNAQSTANYVFSTGATGSLAQDQNGNVIDMSSGTTQLVAASVDDSPAAGLTGFNLGSGSDFDFFFMGQRYGQFSASANGIITLGAVTGTGVYALPNSTVATISAFANDMQIGTDGKVEAKVVGSAPNRTLVIQWTNVMIRYTGSNAPGTGTWQVRLYESSGRIEFVYGAMTTNAATTASYYIGFSRNTTANNVVTVNTTTHTATTSATVASNTYTASSTITALNSASNGSRRFYLFTPSVPNAPTALNFTAVSAGAMTLNWTDNSSNELGFAIYRSTDNVNFSYVGLAAANALSSVQTGLNSGTTYYWRVYAVTEGGVSAAVSATQATNAGSLSGNKTVGGGGADYATLTAAFNDINTNGLSGNVTLILQAGYLASNEPAFPIPTSGAVVGANTVTIYPAVSGLSITSANTTGTLNFNGGKNIIIDGRVGGSGSTPDLVIENTNAGTSYAVQFINDATGNTIKYANIKSRNTSTSSGTIVFAGGVVSGNDNNTISNNNISDGTSAPLIAIYSAGSSSSIENNDNIVSNNNISNYFSAGSATHGIYISSGNSGWSITGNSLFQTAARVYTTSNTHYGIRIDNTSGNGFTVSNNFIGGGAASAGGSAYTMSGVSSLFRGVYVNVGSTSATSVQGNTVTNFSFSTGSTTTTLPGYFSGIHVGAGLVNVGTVSGNTIGATSGTGSINIIATSSGGLSTGIYATSGAVVTIQNNTIGSISTGGTATMGYSFNGIAIAGSGNHVVSQNTIGSATANSITIGTNGTTTATVTAIGINNSGSGTISISSNTINNISAFSTGSSTVFRGINTSAGTVTISNNTISNLSSNTTNTSVGSGALAGLGIYFSAGTAPVFTGNTIYNLSLTNNGTGGYNLAGISYTAPITSMTITKNRIYGLSNASTATSATAPATVSGIFVRDGSGANTTFANNMISLGNGQTTNTAFIGIWAQYTSSTTTTLKVYHNTINVEGTAASGAQPSFALYRGDFSTTAVTAFTMDVKNNIFTNSRTGGTGKHYAIANNYGVTTSSATGWGANASNYNLLNGGVNATVGYWSGDRDFAAWKTASAGDGNSFSGATVTYVNSANDLHLNLGATPTVIESGGTPLPVTDDFDGTVRSTTFPDLGADEGNYTLLDNLAPQISYTALGVSCAPGSRTLTNVTIVDPSGVPTTGALMPRIYFKKGSGAWASTQGTLTSGDGMNGTWSFTIDASLVGGIVTGDVISYYVVAQDQNGTPNIGSNPAGVSGTDVNSIVVHPSGANTYNNAANLAATNTVGASGTYATLTAAANAYNNGCMSGPVTFNLTDATYGAGETFPIVFNSNIQASSTNTLTIKPAAGVTSTITGSVSTDGVIKLNGADYIIIDGSNNGTSSRDLTITNSNTTTPAGIAIVSIAGAGAINNVVKNLNINTAATGLSYGISVGTSPGTSGADNDNTTIQNNNISGVSVGIYASGTAAVNAGGLDNLSITGNNVVVNTTNATAFGIRAANSLNSIISQNTISVKTSASAQPVGISLEAGFTASTVSRNRITDVYTSATGGYGGRGITIGTGTATSALEVSNNVIYGVSGASNYSGFTNSSAMGIAIGVSGNSTTFGTTTGGVNLYYNSVNMNGNFPGYASAATITTALYVGTSTSALDIRNNIFVNTLNNENATYGPTSKSYAFYSAISNTAYTQINNNDYFVSGAQGVLAYLSGDITTLAALKTATGKDANSINANPNFNTNTNLTPLPGSPVVGAGAVVSVTTDFTGASRSATPSIGAYETARDAGAPAITYTPLALTCLTSNRTLSVTITDLSGVATGANAPRVYYRKGTGTWYSSQGTLASGTVTNGTWDFTIDNSLMGGVTSADVISYYVVAQDIASPANVGSNPAGAIGTDVNTITTAPTTPASYIIGGSIGGSYTVGSGGNYPTLTAAVAAYNSNCLSSAVVFNLTDASYAGETFPIVINANADASAVNTLTVKPVTAATISGSSTSALIKLNGAKYVTIDGSNNGSSTRDLTLTNTSTTAGTAVIWIANDGTSGSSNSTVKNSIISTGSNSANATIGISISGTTIGSAGADNDNIVIRNNDISKAYIGVYANGSAGTSTGGLDGLVIAGNQIGSSVTANQIGYTGIAAGNAVGGLIEQNKVFNIIGTVNTPIGIALLAGFNNSTVTRNEVANIQYTGTGGYGARGIYAVGNASANLTISNNVVYGMKGDGDTDPALYNISGIGIGSGSNYNVYHNSVSLFDDRQTGSWGAPVAAGLFIGDAVTLVDVRNNAFSNTMTSTHTGVEGNNYAVYSISATPFSTINNNDYYVTSATAAVGKFIGYLGSSKATLADWQAATTQDANSLAVNPQFNSNTILMPKTGSPLVAAGTGIGSVTVDFKGIARSATTPTIGAYENAGDGTPPVISVSAIAYGCNTGNQTVSANITDETGISTTGLLIPRIYYKKNAGGTWFSQPGTLASGTATNSNWNFTIVAADMGGLTTSDVIYYYVVAQDIVSTPNVGSSPAGVTATDVNTVTVHPTTTLSMVLTGSNLSGNYNVGGGGAYTTLTAAVAAYNQACLTGAVTFTLTDAGYNTNESFPIVINANGYASATNTLTIKPAANTAVLVQGTSGASADGLIKLNGADYVIVDGINDAAGTKLTLENTSATSGSAVIWLASTGAGQGATNNTIKNVILKGGIDQKAGSGTSYGVVIAGNTLSGTITSVTGGNDNDNNTIDTCTFSKLRYGIYTRGGSAANPNTGTVIKRNVIGSSTFGVDEIGKAGIVAREEDGIQIMNNEIRYVGGDFNNNPGSSTRAGIAIATDASWTPTSVFVKNAKVMNNTIHDIMDEKTGAALGVILAGADGTNATNNIVANNFIYNVKANGTSGSNQAVGIGVSAGNGDKVVFNSINLSGSVIPSTGATTPTVSNFGIRVSSTNATNLSILNNIVYMDLTGGTMSNYAIDLATGYAFGTGSMNYNNWFANPANAQSKTGSYNNGAANQSVNLAAWQSATSADGNSKEVDPQFVSPTDLHLQPSSSLDGQGVAVVGVTTDIDGESRSATTPDIGADELPAAVGIDMKPLALVSPVVSAKGCYNTETVTVKIQNNGSSTINFAGTPVTVQVNVSGANTFAYPAKVINTGTLAAGSTMDITVSSTGVDELDMSVPGVYIFDISTSVTGATDVNTANDLLQESRTKEVLTVGTTTASPDGYCNTGGKPFLSATGANGYTSIQWMESTTSGAGFNPIAGATTPTFTVAANITQTMFYKLVATCGTGTDESGEMSVVLNNPQPVTTTPATRCGLGTVTLQATANSGEILNWYAASTGGTAIGTGTSFTTPAINTNTTYYVAASLPNANTFNVGYTNETTGNLASLGGYGMYFNTTAATKINTVKVYPSTAGTLNVELRNAGGTTVDTKAFTIDASDISNTVQKTLVLNFNVPANSTGWMIYYDLATYRGIGTYTYPVTKNGFSITGNTIDGNNITNGTRWYFWDWNVTTDCEGTRVPVTATVTTAPALTSVTATPSSICAGQSSSLQVASANANYTYSWAPVGQNGASVSVTPSSSTLYTVTATDAGTGCVITGTTTVNVNPVPAPIVFTPATIALCPGSPAQQLTFTGGSLTNVPILSEDFNGSATGWTTTNASTGANAALTSWLPQTGPYTWSGTTGITSNDNSQFYASNSDLGGSGSSTQVTLASPSFSTVGFTSVNLSYYNFYQYWNTNDTVQVQVSTNGGSSWTVVKQYPQSTQGVAAAFQSESLNLDAYAGMPSVMVRFRYRAIWGYGWAIDNLLVSGTASTSITWSPSAGLYTDAAGTTAYTGTSTATVYANPATNTTYTVTSTTTASCTATNTVSVTRSSAITNATLLAGTAGGAQVCSGNQDVAVSTNFFNNCNIIATVDPSGGAAVSGNVNACVKIDNTLPSAPNGQKYVQRYFEITPATNRTTATSSITLYFTQGEFNAYNANNNGYPALPTGAADATGIANLRVTQFNHGGVGTDFATYPAGTGSIIDPTDASITYDGAANGGAGMWKVTFNVTGSGAFFVHTGNFVLPVTITNFKGENAGSVNKLYWSTSTETNNYGFELERSADGVNYSKITFVATKANGGNSTSQLSYNFDDVRPLVGANYYRLKQIDNNGKFVYSGVVVLNRKVSEITLTKVYPNPATREINVVITSPRSEKLTLVVTDLTGKVVMQTSTNVVTGDNQQQLNVSALAGGTYMIKAICANGCETAVHRFVKQ